MIDGLDHYLIDEQDSHYDPEKTKIVNVFANSLKKWLPPLDISLKSGLPINTVKKVLRENLPHKAHKKIIQGLFDSRGQGDNQEFRIVGSAITKTIIDQFAEEQIDNLSCNKNFVQAADIFTKSIANANGVSYDDAKSLGLRFAFLYYISQEQENLAWTLNRPETLLEKRLKMVTAGNFSRGKHLYAREKNTVIATLEAILMSMTKKQFNNVYETDVPDNIIARQERSAVYDWLVTPGLIHGLMHPIALEDGRDWKHYTFRLDVEKILAYTNPENVLYDILSKPVYLKIIKDLLKGQLDSRFEQNQGYILMRLKRLGLIKYPHSADELYTEAFNKLQTEKEQKEDRDQRIIIERPRVDYVPVPKLMPKILRYCPSIAAEVLGNANDFDTLESVLERLNFDSTGLEEADIKDWGDLEKFAKNIKQPFKDTGLQLPIFFEPDLKSMSKERFNEIINGWHRLMDSSPAQAEIPYKIRQEIVEYVGKIGKKKFSGNVRQTAIEILVNCYQNKLKLDLQSPTCAAGALILAGVKLKNPILKAEVARLTHTKLTRLNKKLKLLYRACSILTEEPVAPSREILIKVSPVAKKTGDNNIGDKRRIIYADLALAAKERGITDRDALRDFFEEIYTNCGYTHHKARQNAKNCANHIEKQGLDKIAKRGNLDSIKQYLPKAESLEDRASGGKSAESQLAKRMTYADICRAFSTYTGIEDLVTPTDSKTFVEFGIYVYMKAYSLPEKTAKGRVYQLHHRVKHAEGGLAAVSEDGNVERVQPYYPGKLKTLQKERAQIPTLKQELGTGILDSLETMLDVCEDPSFKSIAPALYDLARRLLSQEQDRINQLKGKLEEFKTTYNLK